MQRVKADTIGAELLGKPNQVGKVSEIADSPVARGAHAVELRRKQPATVELAGEGTLGRHDQWRLFLRPGGIDELQPVVTRPQIMGPDNDALPRLAMRDHLGLVNDGPAQRKFGSLRKFGAWLPANANNDSTADKTVSPFLRQGGEDGCEGVGGGDPLLSQGVDELGLDSLGFGLS